MGLILIIAGRAGIQPRLHHHLHTKEKVLKRHASTSESKRKNPGQIPTNLLLQTNKELCRRESLTEKVKQLSRDTKTEQNAKTLFSPVSAAPQPNRRLTKALVLTKSDQRRWRPRSSSSRTLLVPGSVNSIRKFAASWRRAFRDSHSAKRSAVS